MADDEFVPPQSLRVRKGRTGIDGLPAFIIPPGVKVETIRRAVNFHFTLSSTTE
jgi:hypothetical protein